MIFSQMKDARDLTGALAIIDTTRGLLATIIFTCLPSHRRTIKEWYTSITIKKDPTDAENVENFQQEMTQTRDLNLP